MKAGEDPIDSPRYAALRYAHLGHPPCQGQRLSRLASLALNRSQSSCRENAETRGFRSIC